MEGEAYKPGADGVSPMFARFVEETDALIAKTPDVKDKANIASGAIMATYDAESKGAITRDAAVRLRTRYQALGGVGGEKPDNERAPIVKFLRQWKEFHGVADRIARGDHLK